MSAYTSVAEVARNFSEYLDRVARGERFVLMRDARPVAELAPVAEGPRLRDLPALLESLPQLSAEDLDAFDLDLAEARNEIARSPARDPWGS